MKTKDAFVNNDNFDLEEALKVAVYTVRATILVLCKIHVSRLLNEQ